MVWASGLNGRVGLGYTSIYNLHTFASLPPPCHLYAAWKNTMGRDFLFCNLCGTMLTIPSISHSECPLCKTRRSIKNIKGKEISYTISAEDIRRELGINIIDEQKVQLSKVNKKCEKCDHDEATFYTRQMRSADEGQTTFYTCTRCGHQFQEN